MLWGVLNWPGAGLVAPWGVGSNAGANSNTSAIPITQLFTISLLQYGLFLGTKNNTLFLI